MSVRQKRDQGDWKIRAKYVDDLSVVEIIPRCSTSFLPFIARYICTYATEHGMRLNPVKCKEMFTDSLHYKPRHPPPLQLSGSQIERVHMYKLLDVYVTDNVCWSTHCEYIVQRARKRLYALRCLKKSNVMERELVLVYSSLIRSVLGYASPVWANLPEYLSLLIEGVQKKALEIIFPGLPYRDALVRSGLHTFSDWRAAACTKFIHTGTGVLATLPPQRTTVSHGYNLRSATIKEDPAMASTNRL